MSNKKFKPTSYIAIFWNGDGTEKVKEEIYPMHQYSLNEVIELLKGKEATCDIYEGRYWKEREEYITVGRSYIWDAYGWALQM